MIDAKMHAVQGLWPRASCIPKRRRLCIPAAHVQIIQGIDRVRVADDW